MTYDEGIIEGHIVAIEALDANLTGALGDEREFRLRSGSIHPLVQRNGEVGVLPLPKDGL